LRNASKAAQGSYGEPQQGRKRNKARKGKRLRIQKGKTWKQGWQEAAVQRSEAESGSQPAEGRRTVGAGLGFEKGLVLLESSAAKRSLEPTSGRAPYCWRGLGFERELMLLESSAAKRSLEPTSGRARQCSRGAWFRRGWCCSKAPQRKRSLEPTKRKGAVVLARALVRKGLVLSESSAASAEPGAKQRKGAVLLARAKAERWLKIDGCWV